LEVRAGQVVELEAWNAYLGKVGNVNVIQITLALGGIVELKGFAVGGIDT
jgi:hypothetical protein